MSSLKFRQVKLRNCNAGQKTVTSLRQKGKRKVERRRRRRRGSRERRRGEERENKKKRKRKNEMNIYDEIENKYPSGQKNAVSQSAVNNILQLANEKGVEEE